MAPIADRCSFHSDSGSISSTRSAGVASGVRVRDDEGKTRLRIMPLSQVRRRFLNNKLQRGSHGATHEMPASGAGVVPADNNVRVYRRLTLLQRDIS